MMGSRRAIVYLLLVFLLGLALGSVGTFWAWKSGKLRAWWGSRYATHSPVEWLNRELNLTAAQQKQLEAILDETAAGYRDIRERVGPEYEQVRQGGREKIRAILTPGCGPKLLPPSSPGDLRRGAGRRRRGLRRRLLDVRLG